MRQGDRASVGGPVSRIGSAVLVSVLLCVDWSTSPLFAEGQGEEAKYRAAFKLTQRTFFQGEPVWVEFTVENNGDMEALFGIPETRERGFRFTATDGDGNRAPALDPYRPQSGRTVMYTVKPGAKCTVPVLVSKYCTLARTGTYSLSCELDLALFERGPDRDGPPGRRTDVLVRATFALQVEAATDERLQAFVDGLLPDLGGDSPPALWRATQALECISAEAAVRHLEPALKAADARARHGAVRGLAAVATDEAMQALARGIPTADATATIMAVRALGARRTPEALEPLGRLLSHRHAMVRIAAMRAMARIDPQVAVAEIKRSGRLRDEDSQVREVAAQLLGVTAPRAQPPHR